jgi:hypothetical protein
MREALRTNTQAKAEPRLTLGPMKVELGVER